MPTFTPNINLKKPLQTENYNVDDFNGNCDLIDTEVLKLNTKISSIGTDKSDKLIAGTNISLDSDPVLKTVTIGVTGKVASSVEADNSTTLLNKTVSNTIGNILSLIDVGSGVVGLPIIDGSKLTGLPIPDVSGKVNLTDFTGTNQSKTANGWQKVPGGLILQWGTVNCPANTTTTFLFPFAFPNSCFQIVASFAIPATGSVNGDIISTTQFRMQNTAPSATWAKYFSIGN